VTSTEKPREKWKQKDESIETSKDIAKVPYKFKDFDSGEMEGDRDSFINKVKQMCIEKDFRVRIPYADRFDRDGRLQLTFMCSMSSFFHRKKENFLGCPYRMVYKATDTKDIKAFKMSHFTNHHNHHIKGGIDVESSAEDEQKENKQ